MFRPTMQELLNVEQFSQRKFNKIKTEYLMESEASSG
jgi:hypothetical protein